MYKTQFRLTVLSEEPIPENLDLETIMREADVGDYVADEKDRRSYDLSGKQMADELRAAGSDPGFFMLDDDGNKVEN